MQVAIPNGAAAQVTCRLRRRIRLGLRYQGTYRPMCWLKVLDDGSVEWALRVSARLVRRTVQPLTAEYSIQYDEGVKVTDPTLLKDLRVTFHPSGFVNVHGTMPKGEVMRRGEAKFWDLSTPLHLCLILFAHPSTFKSVPDEEIKPFDILIDYPIDENRPLEGHLVVIPGHLWD